MHGIGSRKVPAVAPAVVLPNIKPPIGKSLGERLAARIVVGVPIDGYPVGVKRQLRAGSDLPEVEAAAMQIKASLVQPITNCIRCGRAPYLILREIPNIVENGVKYVFKQSVHADARDRDDSVIVLIKELPPIRWRNLADVLALPRFVEIAVALRGVAKHLFDFLTAIRRFHTKFSTD